MKIVRYGNSIRLGPPMHTPLPWDRRLKPYPHMRKLGVTALSWQEYYDKLAGPITIGEYYKTLYNNLTDLWKNRAKIHRHIFTY